MKLPQRKQNRLPYYNYSSYGAYFVTICTEKRRPTLCRIEKDGTLVLKEQGEVVDALVREIPVRFPCVKVDKYVVMPNHIHLLLFIGDGGTGNPSPTLGNIIGWYKYNATKQANQESGTAGERILQRSFHDHVIRGEKDYLKIWEYIDNNPLKWTEDCFYTTDDV